MNEILIFVVALVTNITIAITLLMFLFKKQWHYLMIVLLGGILGGCIGFFAFSDSVGFFGFEIASKYNVTFTYKQIRVINGSAVGLILAMILVILVQKKIKSNL